jgi:hypothetical protein
MRNYYKDYIAGLLDNEERINYEHINRAIKSGITLDYETYSSQPIEFQHMWMDIFQADLSERMAMMAIAFGNFDIAEDALSQTNSSNKSIAMMRAFLRS